MSIDQHPDGGILPSSVSVDLSGLEGAAVVDYARACFRARNTATATFLVALHEAGRAQDGQKGRRALLDEFSGDEAALALGWSRAMAARWLSLADDLLQRLPEVHAAMGGGDLDDTKARVFSDWTRDLCDDHAHHVCAEVLPEAPELTVGALIERIQEVATAIDPDWAERRERAAEKRARVVSSRNPSGTANVCGYDLPMDRSVVGMARTEALAAELRRRGVAMTIEALRAHVYLTLFDGTAAGLDDDALLDLLTVQLRPDPGSDEGPPDGPGPDTGPDGSGPDGSGPDGSGPGDPGPGGGGGPGGGDGPDDGPAGDHGAGDDATEGGTDDEAADDADPTGADPTGDATPGRPAVRDGTVEVRLRLTTALGHDDLPASVPRWGTVLAPTARALLERHHDGEWRVVLTDDDGRLQHVLLARGRPDRPPGPRRGARRGRAGSSIVELQVPTTLLAALDPDDHPAWTGMLIELRRRLPGLTGKRGAPDHDVCPEDARHRRPGAEVDRWVRVRDRCCIVPGCRRPAAVSDLDHTVDHAHGGPTLSGNLGVLCRHHHRAKHHGGWRVEQPEPGRFRITTRAGARYETAPPRIIAPLPAPRPAGAPRPLPVGEGERSEDGTAGTVGLVRGLLARPRADRGRRARTGPVRRTTATLDSLRTRRPTPSPGGAPVGTSAVGLDPPPF